jgi:hypothetical protein
MVKGKGIKKNRSLNSGVGKNIVVKKGRNVLVEMFCKLS